MSTNANGQHTFHGTNYTHEVVLESARVALTESLTEAQLVARAISRVTPPSQEVRVYAAFADLPHSSYRTGWQVR